MEFHERDILINFSTTSSQSLEISRDRDAVPSLQQDDATGAVSLEEKTICFPRLVRMRNCNINRGEEANANTAPNVVAGK